MSLSASMMAKLSDLTDRFDEVSALLSDPETMADRDRFTALSKEYAELEPLILTFRRHDVLDTELREAQELAGDEDPEMRELAREDVDRLSKALDEEEQELQTLLLPRRDSFGPRRAPRNRRPPPRHYCRYQGRRSRHHASSDL